MEPRARRRLTRWASRWSSEDEVVYREVRDLCRGADGVQGKPW